MKDTYKVIIWGPGHIGGAALKQALLRPEFDVVGVKVYSDHKHGVDIGELVSLPPVGVTATTDRDAVLALDVDCVIFTSKQLVRLVKPPCRARGSIPASWSNGSS